MAIKCRRCGLALAQCSTCKGSGRFTHLFGSNACTRCNGTGWICPNASHDKNWQ